MTDGPAGAGAPPMLQQPLPRPDWLARVSELALEPDLPIIDPHHHFSEHWGGYYATECLADLRSGHDVRATVFVQCGLGYRTQGPPALAPVGETAAVVAIVRAARGQAGPIRLCAGIVGYADLLAGDAVAAVLEAHVEAGEGRFRGIRCSAARHASFRFGVLAPPPVGLYADDRFRRGFARLAPLRLSFDALCYHPGLADVIDLARAFPDTTIVVGHLGGPLGVGDFKGRRGEVFAAWRESMIELAGCANVKVKLGGLGVATSGLAFHASTEPPSSEVLAQAYRPYVETCIEAFGARRCMFESNFPVDKGMYGYAVLWNAFKRITAGATADEKAALFQGTAARCYRLDVGRPDDAPIRDGGTAP